MRTDIVTESNVDRFIEYCSRYGKEHDESFLPDDAFAVSTHQPSYLLWDDHRVIGAVSLIRTQRYVDAKRGRFSIFHSAVPSLHNYSELYQAISQHFDGLDRAIFYLGPQGLKKTIRLLEDVADVLMHHPEKKVPFEY